MCTHNKDNEWYIYLRNKDTMSQSLPQPGGMTHCELYYFDVCNSHNKPPPYLGASEKTPPCQPCCQGRRTLGKNPPFLGCGYSFLSASVGWLVRTLAASPAGPPWLLGDRCLGCGWQAAPLWLVHRRQWIRDKLGIIPTSHLRQFILHDYW